MSSQFLLMLTAALTLAAAPPVERTVVRNMPPKSNLPGKPSLFFIKNEGQLDSRVMYYVHGKDKSLYFTESGVTFSLAEYGVTDGHGEPRRLPTPWPLAQNRILESPATARRWTLKLDFVGAQHKAKPSGTERTPTIVSYFKGPRDQWHTGVPTYSKLIYADLWPGIDLVYEGAVNQLKYSFIVKPGANPHQIRLAYRGATSVTLTRTGELSVSTPVGSFQDGKPYAYQDVGGKRSEVAAPFMVSKGGAAGAQTIGFQIGAFDPTLPLILDPAVLIHAGFVGGSGFDHGAGIAVDGSGNSYVSGWTQSTQSSFPVTVGPDLTYNGDPFDAFVAKVNAAGTALVYAAFIGGSGGDAAKRIAVDDHGNAYVTGETFSGENSFPVTVGPDLTYNGGIDAFVAKVNATGTGLVYAGYVGGSLSDYGFGIALDSSGNSYITGLTQSNHATFPVTTGPDLTFNGDYDAFVVKVNAAGTALVYAGYIGGSAFDQGMGIAVDGLGNAYISGRTDSTEATFPETVGPDLTSNGGSDAFVAKVNTAGTTLVYAGYIGGSGSSDVAWDLAVDGSGNAYVVGQTDSTEATFPVRIGPDLELNGTVDAFVAKVNAEGTSLIYAGYIGGSGLELGLGIAVDSFGNAYMTGYTGSPVDFPITIGPDLSFNGSADIFVAKLNAAGTALVYAGYIGGVEGFEQGWDIAVDGSGNAYIAGVANSDETTFPVTVGPDLTYNGGISDAFVVKIGAYDVCTPKLISDPPAGTSSARRVRNGQTFPLIVDATGCFGEPIRLYTTPPGSALRIWITGTQGGSFEAGDVIPESSSHADTTGYLRETAPGKYIYNLTVPEGLGTGAKLIRIRATAIPEQYTEMTLTIPIFVTN